ncbi:hypothetical protein Kisp02_66360 [Kineosporia sp. NBRC 101731]|nr:hypothetical protein Kisp02_66360 [Kineosporia sp. NBRC 101731]
MVLEAPLGAGVTDSEVAVLGPVCPGAICSGSTSSCQRPGQLPVLCRCSRRHFLLLGMSE